MSLVCEVHLDVGQRSRVNELYMILVFLVYISKLMTVFDSKITQSQCDITVMWPSSKVKGQLTLYNFSILHHVYKVQLGVYIGDSFW